MRLCQCSGCPQTARVAPKLVVPARGYAAIPDNCVAAFVGLELCAAHGAELKPEQWLGPQVSALQGNVRQVFVELTRGKAPLDFARARFELVRLDAPEWTKAKRALDSGRGGGG